MESNASEYAALVVMDYCAEYRGLVKAGIADHLIVGPVEVQWSVQDWMAVLKANPHIVLERHKAEIGTDRWREICTRIASAVRRLDRDQLVVVDEAHFVAPQRQKLPQPVKELATTGRGAGTSTMWVTQRTAEIDKSVLTQCHARMIGGFDGGEIGPLETSIQYPADLHDPGADLPPSGLPDNLLPDDRERPTSLQKHKDPDGSITGTEWIYSDDDGERSRLNTANVSMDSTHYGSEGNDLNAPEYT
ncbi:ATP-binding protein [Haloarcula sp. CBA1129]|nr:ATP-binding protein [Haloarcula sp. CBA1129]